MLQERCISRGLILGRPKRTLSELPEDAHWITSLVHRIGCYTVHDNTQFKSILQRLHVPFEHIDKSVRRVTLTKGPKFPTPIFTVDFSKYQRPGLT